MENFEIKLGDLTAEIEPHTGWLRHVAQSGVPIVSAVYFATRDESWGTVLPTVEIRHKRIGPGLVNVELKSEAANGIRWTTNIDGRDGWLEYRTKGIAHVDVMTGRTGLCVLHPSSLAGGPCLVHHTDGLVSNTCFPCHISPHQPFFNVQGFTFASSPLYPVRASVVHISLSGDIFETEDQRNWGDDSFKTYCRPLSEPYPYLIKAGETIEHKFRLTETTPSFPLLGSIFTDDTAEQTVGVLDFVYRELDANDRLEVWESQFDAWGRGGASSYRVAITGYENLNGLGALISVLAKHPIQGIELRCADSTADPAPAVAIIRKNLSCPIFAGAGKHFTELNRNRPNMDLFDGVAFAYNPQVHAHDERSIIDTTYTLATQIRDARAIAGGKLVSVGPITFQPRHWEEGRDPRIGSEFYMDWRTRALWAAAGAFPYSIVF